MLALSFTTASLDRHLVVLEELKIEFATVKLVQRSCARVRLVAVDAWKLPIWVTVSC